MELTDPEGQLVASLDPLGQLGDYLTREHNDLSALADLAREIYGH